MLVVTKKILLKLYWYYRNCYASIIVDQSTQPLGIKSLIEGKGRRYQLAKGQVVQTTDSREVLNLIKSGYVKRYMIANDGAVRMQVIYGPGGIFPITIAFKKLVGVELNEGPEVYYYECLTPTEVLTIDALALETAVKQDPDLYKDLFGLAGHRLNFTLHGLENIGLSDSYHRLAHQIAYLAEQFGQKTTGGTAISVPLTHQDLADILALTRETVSTNIIKLRQKGLIKTTGKLTVPNLKKLQKEAYS